MDPLQPCLHAYQIVVMARDCCKLLLKKPNLLVRVLLSAAGPSRSTSSYFVKRCCKEELKKVKLEVISIAVIVNIIFLENGD